MLRGPVSSRFLQQKLAIRKNSSSSFIRSTFVEYFTKQHAHKNVKSSSVVPLCDPTVPFVNAGMNQFKGVFLGNIEPPCQRAVNSQKCIRVGGKHNDLDLVGTDGHHHTFFEMLGNWSFGDYYKEEACRMAWDLLTGPYRLKPKELVVTYFNGDVILNLQEDRECRDIWRSIGVQGDRLRGLGARENFWEMSTTGPCGPCTEIHYVNPDGTLTEIWNIVFIQCDRQSDGSVRALRRHHVDTGMGLERTASILQRVPTNYDTDLFKPLLRAIHQMSENVSPYSGSFGPGAALDGAYRRLADHARAAAVCLADGAFPATSLNLKKIMRKCFKMSSDVFHKPGMLVSLYDVVAETLGETYPELVARGKEAKLIIEHEEIAYDKMRKDLEKKFKGLSKQYPEVENLGDVEMSGFPLGYTELKETMSKLNSSLIPGELVFKLYDTHGFQQDLIDRIALINNLSIDKEEFHRLLTQHKSRHKTAFKERSLNRGLLFDEIIDKLVKIGYTSTLDNHKYNYSVIDNIITFPKLKTKLLAILNEECEWIDFLEPCENKPYYLVTEDTNFYCEEGGQVADIGVIEVNNYVDFKVDSVFKIRGFVFHKGSFVVRSEDVIDNCVKCQSEVTLQIDNERRVNVMRNHTGVHLLNAALREVLSNSVVCQIGSRVTDRMLSLNLSVYGQKLTQDVLIEAQNLVRTSIRNNSFIDTRVIDNVQLSVEDNLVTVPGEIYPETGLRMVQVENPLRSKELCCGTHVPSTGFLEEFVLMLVKGAGGQTPLVHALTGSYAKQALELFSRAEHLEKVLEYSEGTRNSREAVAIEGALRELCDGARGAPGGEYATCSARLAHVRAAPAPPTADIQSIAEAEIMCGAEEAAGAGREFVVQFVRSSYLMRGAEVRRALRAAPPAPALLFACAGGVISAAAHVPQEAVCESFTAERWLRCVLPVFGARLEPGDHGDTFAEMTPTKASLITCERLVQEAMRVAEQFAAEHRRREHQGRNTN